MSWHYSLVSDLGKSGRNWFVDLFKEVLRVRSRGVRSKKRSLGELPPSRILLSQDSTPVLAAQVIYSNKFIHLSNAIFNKYINEVAVAQALYSEILKVLKMQETDLREYLSPIFTFLIALSPVYEVVTGHHDDSLYEAYSIRYGISHLTEGLVTTFILGQNAVAHRFVYGSVRFANTLSSHDTEAVERFHEKVTHEIAPTLYDILSSINLITNHIDKNLIDIKNINKIGYILEKLSFRYYIKWENTKVFMFTGLGNALGGSLIYGIMGKGDPSYVLYGFGNIVIGIAYILQVINNLQVRKETYSMYSAYNDFLSLRAIAQKVSKDHRINWEMFYGLNEALRDFVIIKMLYSGEIGLVERLNLSS